jgi:hypothetical protein
LILSNSEFTVFTNPSFGFREPDVSAIKGVHPSIEFFSEVQFLHFCSSINEDFLRLGPRSRKVIGSSDSELVGLDECELAILNPGREGIWGSLGMMPTARAKS